MSKTIDLTPSWYSLVGWCIAILSDDSAPAESRKIMTDTLTQMSKIADLYVALVKAAGMNQSSIDPDELIKRVTEPKPVIPDRSAALEHAIQFLSNEYHFSSPGAVAEAKEIQTKLDHVYVYKVNDAPTDDAGEQREIPSFLGGECAYPDKLFLSTHGHYIRAKGPHGWNIANMEDQAPFTRKTAEKLVLAYNYHDELCNKLHELASYCYTIGGQFQFSNELGAASELLKKIKSETK